MATIETDLQQNLIILGEGLNGYEIKEDNAVGIKKREKWFFLEPKYAFFSIQLMVLNLLRIFIWML